MNKLTALLALAFSLACASPPAEPPVVEAKPASAHADAPVITTLSTELTNYANSTKEWSIGLPENMKVVKQDDDQVQVQAEDGSLIGLLRAPIRPIITTKLVADGIVASMKKSGEPLTGRRDIKVGEWDATMMIFHTENAPDLTTMTVFTTGSYAYIYLYLGYATHERSKAYWGSMETIVVSETGSTSPAKPVAPTSTKQTAPAKKTTH